MKLLITFVAFCVLASCSTDPILGGSESALEQARAADPPAPPFDLPAGAVVVEPPPGADWAIQLPMGPAGPTEDAVADADGDGFVRGEDPDDENPDDMPPEQEMLCNGRDEDEDGVDNCPPDLDGDGAHAAVDCDDADPSVGPLAREVRCDGRDQNCDGHDLCDTDGDGVVDWDDRAPDDPDVGAHPAVDEEL